MEKSGRMRDNITTLTEMANALCETVDMRQASSSRAEPLQVALTEAVLAMGVLHDGSHHAQVDTRILWQELTDNIEKTCSWLGISREQEGRINQTMLASVDKFLNLLEVSGNQADTQMDKVLAALHDGHVGGEIDLF